MNKLINFTPKSLLVLESKKKELCLPTITATLNAILEQLPTVSFSLFEKGTKNVITLQLVKSGYVFYTENGIHGQIKCEEFIKWDLYKDIDCTIPFDKSFFESKILKN